MDFTFRRTEGLFQCFFWFNDTGGWSFLSSYEEGLYKQPAEKTLEERCMNEGSRLS